MPTRQSYLMPAEWEKHDATWLSWPKDPVTFPNGIIEQVEATYAKMVKCLAAGETVNILVDDAETRRRVSSILGIRRRVVFHEIRSVDVWIRDYGPIFVR